jgi:hypothetical protein
VCVKFSKLVMVTGGFGFSSIATSLCSIELTIPSSRPASWQSAARSGSQGWRRHVAGNLPRGADRRFLRNRRFRRRLEALDSRRAHRTDPWPIADRRRSFLGHPGLAQSSEISGFDQGLDLRHAPRRDRPQVGDAGITIIANQSSGFGELGCGALDLAVESIG